MAVQSINSPIEYIHLTIVMIEQMLHLVSDYFKVKSASLESFSNSGYTSFITDLFLDF